MISTRIHVGPAAPARGLARTIAVVALLGTCGVAPATADVALYQAAVPLTGNTEPERKAAMAEALLVAAVRATGRREAAQAPRIAAAASDPSAYVQQYSTGADRMLHVGFDGRAIEQLLQQAGLPLWPAERPTVSVLLVMSGPQAEARTLTSGDRVPARGEVERVAQLRGVPIEWPGSPLDAATARGQLGRHEATLLGELDGGVVAWTFVHAGQTVRARGDAGDGVDLAADALASRYAPASTRSLNTVTVRIGGLGGVRAYASLTRYLEDLSLVRAVRVGELARDSARFELAVRGDLELLRRIFALERRLVPAAAATDAAPDVAEFLWQP